MSKLTPQTKWLLAIFVVILINACVWYFGLSPALEDSEAIQDKIAQVEQERESMAQRLQILNAIDVGALELELAELNVQLPELGQLREFLMGLDQTAADLDLFLALEALAQTPAAPYLIMDIKIRFQGEYRQVFSYLQALEQHERLLLVRDFNMTYSNGTIVCVASIAIFAEDFDTYTPHQAPGRDNPYAN